MGRKAKWIRREVPWSDSSPARIEVSQLLDEPLEDWIRSKVLAGVSDHEMGYELYDRTGLRIPPDTIREWRRSLGFRKVSIKDLGEAGVSALPPEKRPGQATAMPSRTRRKR